MELKTVWERIIAAVMTTPHSEKVIYFDKLGKFVPV